MEKTKTKFNATLSRTLTGAQLQKIYDRLEDKATPYEATVKNVHGGKRLLTMRIQKENKQYFQELVKSACYEAKV